MLKVSEHKQHAAECRDIASRMRNPEQRHQLEDIAQAWEMLAIEREKFLNEKK